MRRSCSNSVECIFIHYFSYILEKLVSNSATKAGIICLEPVSKTIIHSTVARGFKSVFCTWVDLPREFERGLKLFEVR